MKNTPESNGMGFDYAFFTWFLYRLPLHAWVSDIVHLVGGVVVSSCVKPKVGTTS